VGGPGLEFVHISSATPPNASQRSDASRVAHADDVAGEGPHGARAVRDGRRTLFGVRGGVADRGTSACEEVVGVEPPQPANSRAM
jgi:hypothetical protein